MTPSDFDYPLSAFRSATSHLLGRLLFVVIVLALAVLLGAGIARLTGDHLSSLGALMLYPILVIGGIAQIHGIVAYALVFIAGAIYILRETSHLWLLVIFITQAIEAGVWCSSWTLG